MITERIDSITAIKDFREVLPAPKSVKIELTGRCNYRCGFCALRTRKIQPKEDMDFGFFQRITQEMKHVGVQEIGVFYLGESCMNSELLVKAIKHVKDIGIGYCFLTTNGSLLEPALAERVMEAGLDSLKFSINAADDVQFKEVMGVKSALYMDAFENLRAAWKIRNSKNYSCGLYASSIKYDGEQQNRMMLLLEEKVFPYVDEHYWLPLYSMGSLATQREKELGYRPTAGNQGRLDNMRDPLPCWSAFTEGHITADGKLSACCFDANSNWVMADLKKVGFMEGWNSAKFVNLRKAHLKKDVSNTVCKDCIAYN